MIATIATLDTRPVTGLCRITTGGRDPITGAANPSIYLVTDSNGGLHYAPADTIQVAAS